MILRIIPANSPQRARKPRPNDWPCCTTTEVNPPQRSTKQREKSGLALPEAIYAAARSSLSVSRITIFITSFGDGCCNAFASFTTRALDIALVRVTK
jgi:hypothetical protein